MDVLILIGSFTVVCLLGMPVAWPDGWPSAWNPPGERKPLSRCPPRGFNPATPAPARLVTEDCIWAD